jgi:hypothetical protein
VSSVSCVVRRASRAPFIFVDRGLESRERPSINASHAPSRSGVEQVRVASLAQAVEECVYNSLDAGASSVEVALELSSLHATIHDDGVGVLRGDMDHLGVRHYTSKAEGREHTCVGSRGESLCAIAGTTPPSGSAPRLGPHSQRLGSARAGIAQVEVLSRPRGQLSTHRKVFQVSQPPPSSVTLYVGVGLRGVRRRPSARWYVDSPPPHAVTLAPLSTSATSCSISQCAAVPPYTGMYPPHARAQRRA